MKSNGYLYPSMNYHKNIYSLREKVTQDLSLRSNIFNINRRKPIYKVHQPSVTFVETFPSRNKTNSSYQKTNSTNSSFNTSKPSRVVRTITLTEKLLNSMERGHKQKRQEIQRENQYLYGRIKRVSSPLSRKSLKAHSLQKDYLYNNCRRVKTYSEIQKREKDLIAKLPKIYKRNGRYGF